MLNLCAQNYLYAIGGNNGTASLDTCERYDPHLNKWTSVESMKKRRAGAGVAELHGCLYVVGMLSVLHVLVHDGIERLFCASDGLLFVAIAATRRLTGAVRKAMYCQWSDTKPCYRHLAYQALPSMAST